MSLQRIFARGKSNKDKQEEDDYKKEDITLRLYRSIATPIVNIIYPINVITPNRLTWLGFFIALISGGILFIAGTNIFLLFMVGLGYWFSALLDCVDGQLARMRGISSKNGAWLDSILEEGKGIPFFFALAFHVQDANGFFALKLGTIDILTLNIWFVLCVMFSASFWLSLMALWGNVILDEPRIVSFGNIYIAWVFLIFNQLEWFLILYTVGAILALVYTLFEKTFIAPVVPLESNDQSDSL
jgi:phosphatidylglycerophosphate synthase